MNNSAEYLINIIIDYSTITFSSISICISTLLFIFLAYHIIKKPTSPHRVPLLLTANMYVALLMFFISMIDLYIRTLHGHIYSDPLWNEIIYCQIRGYFLLVSICSIFYANALQAMYRLCRVVFYTNRFYQSFPFYIIAIIIKWLVCFLLLLPSLLIGDFDYLAEDFRCQIQYINIRTALITGTLIYAIPISITLGCYVYTLRKIRNTNNPRQRMTHIQLIAARRDLIVIFRIFILFGLMILFIIPTAVGFLINKFSGYNPWWSISIQWFSYILSMASVNIVLVRISPHAWNLYKQYIHI